MSRTQFPSADAQTQSETERSRLRSPDTWLWAFVVVALVLDVALTYYGLTVGLHESNPVARTLFSMYGVVESMLLLKGAVIAVALVAYTWLPERYRPIVPLGVATPWFVAGLINAGLILQV